MLKSKTITVGYWRLPLLFYGYKMDMNSSESEYETIHPQK